MIWIVVLVVAVLVIAAGLSAFDVALSRRAGAYQPPRVVCGHCGLRHEVTR